MAARDPACASVPELLRSCHGFAVCVSGDVVAEVETPLFQPGSSDPDFLLLRVRVDGRLFPRFRVLPAALVERVEAYRLVVDSIVDLELLPGYALAPLEIDVARP